jgi:hypothetical protein
MRIEDGGYSALQATSYIVRASRPSQHRKTLIRMREAGPHFLLARKQIFNNSGLPNHLHDVFHTATSRDVYSSMFDIQHSVLFRLRLFTLL